MRVEQRLEGDEPPDHQTVLNAPFTRTKAPPSGKPGEAMFGLFRKDPRKALQQQYQQKLEQAMQYQRNGDIMNYSLLSAEAAELEKQLQALDDAAAK